MKITIDMEDGNVCTGCDGNEDSTSWFDSLELFYQCLLGVGYSPIISVEVFVKAIQDQIAKAQAEKYGEVIR